MLKVFQCLIAIALYSLALVISSEFLTPIWPGAHLVDTAQGQDIGTGKRVLIDRIIINDAVRVIKVMENGQEIIPGFAGNPEASGQRINAGVDWIGNLSFVVKNRTRLSIAYVNIVVAFPEDQHYDQILQFGQVPAPAAAAYFHHPPHYANVPKGSGPPLSFGPGQEITISLYGYVDSIKMAQNTARTFSSLTKCAILAGVVYFEDGGLKWEKYNGYKLPDSESPEGYKHLPDGYFPGGLSQANGSD